MTAPGSATQRVYEFIRSRLQNQVMRPGARLVTRELAREFGTSLNPVREALNRLATEGLVNHVPGSGMYAHRPQAQLLRDLLGLREAIESYAAAEAAHHIRPEQLEVLRSLCDKWRGNIERMREDPAARTQGVDFAEWIEDGHEFHTTLILAAGNDRLNVVFEHHHMLETLFRQLHDVDARVTLDTIERAHATHCQLVETIAIGDADSARRQMQDLLRSRRDEVLSQIGGHAQIDGHRQVEGDGQVEDHRQV